MRFLIIQPSWDHSEILASLLYFIKQANLQVKIIYDWSHPEGNYLDYYCELFGFEDKVKINFKTPKHHIEDVVNAHKVIFVDEVHLRKFLSKNVFLQMMNKFYTFNHVSKKLLYDIKTLHLGLVPYNFCQNTKKTLVNSFYNPNNQFKNLDNKLIKFLIVGNPNERNIEWLNYLPKRDNYIIYFVHRKVSEINHPNIIVKENLPTNDLIKLINETDYLITLFKEKSCYHRDRISGIVPFGISFGKPILMDQEYNELNQFTFIDKELIYQNNLTNFIKIFENILEIKAEKYKNFSENIIKYRDVKITEQYLNFHLLFE
jgi:hypothetical protein